MCYSRSIAAYVSTATAAVVDGTPAGRKSRKNIVVHDLVKLRRATASVRVPKAPAAAPTVVPAATTGPRCVMAAATPAHASAASSAFGCQRFAGILQQPALQFNGGIVIEKSAPCMGYAPTLASARRRRTARCRRVRCRSLRLHPLDVHLIATAIVALRGAPPAVP